MKKTLTKSLSVLTAVLMLVCVCMFRPFVVSADGMPANTQPVGNMSELNRARHNTEVLKNDALKRAAEMVSALKSKAGEIWDGSIAEGFAGGSGTKADPYLISNGGQLAYLAQQVNGGNDYASVYFVMTGDIYLNDTEGWESWGIEAPDNAWTSIGKCSYNPDSEEEIRYPFRGSFDGNGFSVYGVYINKVGDDWYEKAYQGLFGMSEGFISNLGLTASYVKGGTNVGGILGYGENGSTISNCCNTGNICGSSYVGGVAGRNWNGSIENCCNFGNISGNEGIGGVIGYNDEQTASRCYNAGNVDGGDGYYAGGVAGCCYGSSTEFCYNIGAVHGSSSVGGIVGDNYNSSVNCCYNIGGISSDIDEQGAITGYSSGDITCCYYMDTSCESGDDNGTALTDEQMQSAESYVGFDFETVWTMEGNADYPYPELIGNIHSGEEEPVVSDGIWDGTVAEGFAGGSGTEADPYLISSGSELAYLAHQTNSGIDYTDTYFKLIADIRLNDTENWENWQTEPPANEWTRIGILSYNYDTEEETNHPFIGCFDGNGYTVSGVYIDKSAEYENPDLNISETSKHQGLFGSNSGIIANLTVDTSYICGGWNVGGIVGISSGAIYNCRFFGNVSGYMHLAGIAGDNYFGYIMNCCNEGSVIGNKEVGGLAGVNHGVVADSCNTGNIDGTGNKVHAGGIVGWSYQGGIINCCNYGNVIGNDAVGGITGESDSSSFVTGCRNEGTVCGAGANVGGVAGYTGFPIANCCNTGDVTGESFVGGVVGKAEEYAVIECYNTGNITGSSTVGGITGSGHIYFSYNTGDVDCSYAGAITAEGTAIFCYYKDSCCVSGNSLGTALTNEQLLDEENYAGFDFHNVWAIESETGFDYPQFMDELDSDYGGASAIWDGSVAEGFAGGIGTEAEPYIIETAEQFAYFAAEVNNGTDFNGKFVKLTDDIEFNDYNAENWIINASAWTTVGIVNMQGEAFPFCGTFDGDGHTVSGLYVNGENELGWIESNQGLFGCCKGTIMNINVLNSYIHGIDCVGAIVGNLLNGNIENCSCSAAVNGYSGCIGGIAGEIRTSSVINCRNTGVVNGENCIGGIVGWNYDGIVVDCSNAGTPVGNWWVGGICGAMDKTKDDEFGCISRCYNTADVIGIVCVGGVIGDDGGHVTDCYNIGVVTGENKTAGVAGQVYNGMILGCYNIGAVVGTDEIGAVIGYYGHNDEGTSVYGNCYYLENCCSSGDNYAEALTDAQLRSAESYVGFNFTNIWTMQGNPDYPYAELVGNNHVGEWDEPEPSVNPGDYDCDGDVDVEDAILTLRAAMELITPSAQSLFNADMDGDGVLTTADALTILRMTMGLL